MTIKISKSTAIKLKVRGALKQQAVKCPPRGNLYNNRGTALRGQL